MGSEVQRYFHRFERTLVPIACFVGMNESMCTMILFGNLLILSSPATVSGESFWAFEFVSMMGGSEGGEGASAIEI